MTAPVDAIPLQNCTPQVRRFQNALECATWHTETGIYTVPVAHRGKNPVDLDWINLRIDTANLPAHYNGRACNTGGLLGISRLGSSGLVDADQDCREAVALARVFLPDTAMIFGHASKPASHRLYFTDQPVRLQQFRDPLTKTMVVELRGTKKNGEIGLQTVLPGSEHPS